MPVAACKQGVHGGIDFYAAAREMLNSATTDYDKQIAMFAKHWAPNLTENVKRGYFDQRKVSRFMDIGILARSASKIKKPKPVTLFGAGPSAAREIDNISRETTLLVVDRELEHILEHGHRPDFVVTADPKIGVSEFFKGIDTRGMALVAPVYTHPETIANWHGTVWFYRHPDNKHSWFPGFLNAASGVRGYLYAGGNVSATAFSMAYGVLHASAIFMCGMDYSWTDNFYGDGKRQELKPGPETAGEEIDTVDVYGNPVKTLAVLLRYVQNIEGMMEIVSGDRFGCRYYNCSGGLIRGRAIITDLLTAYEAEGIARKG